MNAGDSGPGVGNHEILSKQNVYDEDGMHVPFIISGGKVKQKAKELGDKKERIGEKYVFWDYY